MTLELIMLALAWLLVAASAFRAPPPPRIAHRLFSSLGERTTFVLNNDVYRWAD